ncbi:MAG: peptidyl-prolyl cis-trans isomerase [Candidatus Aminicenantes bacterium]|nr:peptidyl-prolyl cis-trans isomerase [Candidatus Aminicenantes bacterium]
MKLIFYFGLITLVLFQWCCSDHSASTEKGDLDKRDTPSLQVDTQEILVVGNKHFTNSNLKEFIKNQYPDIASSYNNHNLLSRLFDIFIEQEVILYEIEKDKINLDKIETKDFMETLQIETKLKSRHFNEKLKTQKYLYFKIYQEIKVTDKEIRDYYNDNKEQFRKNDEVLLYQIFVKNKEKSTQISGVLKNFPNKFEETASKESESPDAKHKGLMGYFERGTLPKDMEDMVFSLKINEISPVVETPYGYHIFKVTKKRKKRMMFLSAVKEDIKSNILSEKFKSAYEAYLAKLKNNINIKINHKNLFFPYFATKGDQNEKI